MQGTGAGGLQTEGDCSLCEEGGWGVLEGLRAAHGSEASFLQSGRQQDKGTPGQRTAVSGIGLVSNRQAQKVLEGVTVVTGQWQ